MKKVFAFFLAMSVFLLPLSIISTEKEASLSNGLQYQLLQNPASQVDYFSYFPENPVLKQDAQIYEDVNLSKPLNILTANTQISLNRFLINDTNMPVFELSNGGFISASYDVIYDDVILSQEPIDATFWVGKKAVFYPQPFVTGVKPSEKSVTDFTSVQVSQKATTNHGTYYKVEEKGWIDATILSENDNRMAHVQDILNEKYQNADISVYVKDLDSQEVAQINADKVMYSASITKLPILYYAQEKLDTKTFSLDNRFKYNEASMNFDGAYDTDGSGDMSKLPDDKEYSLESLLKAVSQNSDNVASNLLGYYVDDKYDANYQTSISKAIGTNWDMVGRNSTAQQAGLMMEAIYYQNGTIIDYLSQTKFDNERISKDIDVQVAHKIGDAYDFRHDVAIVYAEKPFILSIFTDHASYDDITAIANDVYGVLK
ncbi:serine hydrolase [Streptococcus sp. CSL10205-OR2]|uniref:serine hydrolase n=1 Tax=Streptococcus sp. CSL10205-OR2 TaxID=2980558 RepID=UPI0021DA086B|nr:serine hydrolase [Streptococcus sp. CSL10205-OR2]MCU9533867.1 class A beta-lactamase-related serine hydrolase [Streptococcus sp. CSL10205-OR2]